MEISCKSVSPTVSIVVLNGALNARSAEEAKQTFRNLKEQGVTQVIVDLNEVPFIDSSGLASLVSGLRLAREKSGIIALSGVQPQAQTVFHLTMLDRIFPIHPTYNDAKLSLM